MIVQNSTSNQIFYSISSPGSADCGTIDAGQATEVGYNNQTDVNVSLRPIDTSEFSVTIPQTGTGKVVTVGLYFE